MKLDREKIKKRFSEVDETLIEIKRLVEINDDDLWSKKENIAALKYYLLQAIEAVGAVCVHIAAQKFGKGISSFGECFEILENKGAVSEELSEKLGNWLSSGISLSIATGKLMMRAF